VYLSRRAGPPTRGSVLERAVGGGEGALGHISRPAWQNGFKLQGQAAKVIRRRKRPFCHVPPTCRLAPREAGTGSPSPGTAFPDVPIPGAVDRLRAGKTPGLPLTRRPFLAGDGRAEETGPAFAPFWRLNGLSGRCCPDSLGNRPAQGFHGAD